MPDSIYEPLKALAISNETVLLLLTMSHRKLRHSILLNCGVRYRRPIDHINEDSNDERALNIVALDGGRGGRRSKGPPRGRNAKLGRSSNPSDASSSVNATSDQVSNSSAPAREDVGTFSELSGSPWTFVDTVACQPSMTGKGAQRVRRTILWMTRPRQRNKATVH